MNWTDPLIVVIAFGLYGLLHSVLAGPRVKGWARRTFGEDAFRRSYRLFFNIAGGVTLLPVLFLVWWLPDQPLYRVPGWLEPLFLLVQAAGVLLLLAALQSTDGLDFLGFRQLADPSREPKLVTGGVYAWMRHPLYTGSLLVLWPIPAMSVNQFAFLTAVSAYFVVGALYEERKLERYFGKAYASYKQRTPMFVPIRKPAPR